jgi:murein DD-endopeptidase MepM/ murein hydrolase activator NlpD
VASNNPALIPGSQQHQDQQHQYVEWDTAEWTVAAGWTPPATEQAAPTKNAVDGWDTAEWNMAAGWAELREAAAAAGLMADELAAEAAAKDAAPEPHEQAESHEAPYEPYGPDEQSETPYETWNPTRESTAPPRGRHKVSKPGLFSRRRGSAVFGVAAVAALGVGSGVATAEGHNPLAVSLPDLPSLPDVSSVPGVGALVSAADETPDADPADNLGIDAGEALRTRILDQASAQKYAADNAAAVAEAKSVAAEKVRAQAAAHKAAAAAAKKKAEAARLAELAKQYVKPVASYTLTAGFGESSSLWSSTHTGQDFAAPTGTPVKAIHGGTITSAGWAGSYGYRIILTLDDGTELWFCHLSSMTVTSGKVATGDTIGRVGSTGNTTGPHLHLEVRPGGGDPIDPMPWLRAKGLQV